MVYILNESGQPLMPTMRYGHVRKLLKAGRASVVKRCPFTVRLLYESTHHVQPVSLGIDAGSKHIGLSACKDTKELYSADIEIRQDINKLLEERRSLRRSRRNRKTRYRKPRFNNRTRSEKWLAPSVKAKCEAHLNVVQKVRQILPASEIHIEMAPFDTQLLKAQLEGAELPEGTDYQHGEAEGFDNIKAYVKFRDNYRCAVCGKQHIPLEVHHRLQKHDGGSNRPDNLITVCHDCHKAFHDGTLTGRKVKIMLPPTEKEHHSMQGAAFMSIMRWAVYGKLKETGLPVHMTYGYITARQREKYDLQKDHRIDAKCISGHGNAVPSSDWYQYRKIRCHNRQLYKQTIQKHGIRKKNQAPYLVKGYRLFDKVSFNGQEGFITGRRSSGYFTVKTINNEVIHNGVSCKKLKFLDTTKHLIVERRSA